jgi:cell fate regulator YaaT (PSP1 superfamily)
MEDNQTNDKSLLTRGCCSSQTISDKGKCRQQSSCAKLDAQNWLLPMDLVGASESFNCVEVRFKNSNKDFYKIPADLGVETGDIVAVEASPGHDIGIVSLTGETARLQMTKKKIDPESDSIKSIYRHARASDVEKWIKASEREDSTLIKSRQLVDGLGLKMKVNDVAFQGDETKAIFYYTADDRVDFRQLIRVLAETFRVRIEMRQIGVRQEAARVGGIGSCGRELCCSTWLTNFTSVTTHVARTQQLSLNPQKLAGQCGKLKCCLNFEYDSYSDALSNFPDANLPLKTKKGDAVFQKMDVFQGIYWYAYLNEPGSFMAVPVKKVKYILDKNKNGQIPDDIESYMIKTLEKKKLNGIEEGDLTRFDRK